MQSARAFLSHPSFSRLLALAVLTLLAIAMNANAHGISEADQQAMIDGGNLRYLWLGAIHMLTGYDHLLFLFGVIFYLTHFKDVLKFVTVFTLGHSITLIAATYAGITANYYLVDAVIALSVCYKAFDNLDGFKRFLGFNPPNLLSLIFAFGLIHGFGLSTRLQQLPLPEHGLIWRILSFNLGVELGQVAALAVLVFVLAGLRKTASFKTWGTVANALLFLAGVGLFFFQMTGFLLGRFHHDHHDDHKPAAHQEAPHRHEGAEAPHAHTPEGHSRSTDTGLANDTDVIADSARESQEKPATKPTQRPKHSHSHGEGPRHTH
jgi:HupE / UreJ protein